MGFGDYLRCEKKYSKYREEDCAHIFPQGELQGNIKPEQRKGWCDLGNGVSVSIPADQHVAADCAN